MMMMMMIIIIIIIIIKEFPHIWKSKAYYQQSKKDVTLEVKVARIS